MTVSKATPKQVREIMRKIYFHQDRLQRALNEAHEKEIISYPQDAYEEKAPCWATWEARRRIDATTEKAMALAMKNEIRLTIK